MSCTAICFEIFREKAFLKNFFTAICLGFVSRKWSLQSIFYTATCFIFWDILRGNVFVQLHICLFRENAFSKDFFTQLFARGSIRANAFWKAYFTQLFVPRLFREMHFTGTIHTGVCLKVDSWKCIFYNTLFRAFRSGIVSRKCIFRSRHIWSFRGYAFSWIFDLKKLRLWEEKCEKIRFLFNILHAAVCFVISKAYVFTCEHRCPFFWCRSRYPNCLWGQKSNIFYMRTTIAHFHT